jgi:hypothetical protein
MADRFHNQPFSISLFAQRSLYYYFLYYALHLIKIKPKDFGKLFVYFSVIFMLFYLIQYILYPRVILFDARIIKERGTIRILLEGMPYLIISYYYALQKFLESQKLKYSLFLLASLIIVIFIGSRSLLFTILATTMLNLILSKRIKSKLLIYTISTLGIVMVIFIFQNIFKEIIETALYRDPLNSENIRYKTLKYFLSGFSPNTLTYIFGNGASGASSELTRNLWVTSQRYGYYLSDIGLIGEYVSYGIIFILSILLIIYKTLTSKIQPQFNYIKYYYAFIVIAMVLGGGFDNSDFIVLICITLYIIDVSKFRIIEKENKKITTDETHNQIHAEIEEKEQIP